MTEFYPPTPDSIESALLFWLVNHKRPVVVLTERTPRHRIGYDRPDMLAILQSRFLFEIEVKRSVSDFKNDANKNHVANRDFCVKQWPRQFYYAVPIEIREKVQPLVPDWAGLLTVSAYRVDAVKRAPLNKESRRLSVKEVIRLGKNMGSQLTSLMFSLEGIKCHYHEPWGCEYMI